MAFLTICRRTRSIAASENVDGIFLVTDFDVSMRGGAVRSVFRARLSVKSASFGLGP